MKKKIREAAIDAPTIDKNFGFFSILPKPVIANILRKVAIIYGAKKIIPEASG